MANVGWWGKANLNTPKGVMLYVPNTLRVNFSHHWLPHRKQIAEFDTQTQFLTPNLIKPFKREISMH